MLILSPEVCHAIKRSFTDESEDGCTQFLMDLISAQIGDNMLANYAKIVYYSHSRAKGSFRFVEVDNQEREMRGHESDVAVFVAFY